MAHLVPVKQYAMDSLCSWNLQIDPALIGGQNPADLHDSKQT